jgi:hypothetical protein
MTMELAFPLPPHFATLYFNKKSKSIFLVMFQVNEQMYLLQVIKISYILQNFLKLIEKFK